MAKSARETPLYTVWRHDLGETSCDGAQYGALDVRAAAELHARYSARRTGQGTGEYYVQDPDGTNWRVSVRRRDVVEYHAQKPKKVR